MQDRFVGDIGDFGKYSLLRALTGIYPALPEHKRLSLGVVWYVPDLATEQNTKSTHGLKVSYLKQQKSYRVCDAFLFDSLKNLVDESERSIRSIEDSGILGNSTQFYGDRVPEEPRAREEWASRAQRIMSEQSIVFLDPDTGLIPARRRNASTGHVYQQEIKMFLTTDQTIIVYQHHAYTDPQIEGQRRNWSNTLQNLQFQESITLCFEQRDFIILPAAERADLIDERLAKMLAGPWKQHFKCYPGG